LLPLEQLVQHQEKRKMGWVAGMTLDHEQRDNSHDKKNTFSSTGHIKTTSMPECHQDHVIKEKERKILPEDNQSNPMIQE